MIVCARGVLSGADLSTYVERTNFSVEATFGARMDVLKMQLHDPGLTLAIPDRAEIIIYDAPAGSNVVDPPFAISPYNTFLNGAGSEHTSGTPSAWTPRFFAGYSATPVYSLTGTERIIQVQAQDYTYRLRSTIVNQAFAAGNTDQFIVQSIFAKYRPDFDATNVALIVASMPSISFPVHSLEQFMQRVIKISRGVYRVDYFKRLFYGPIGQVSAPFNLSDTPVSNVLTNPSFEPSWATGAVWNLYNNGPESAAIADSGTSPFDGANIVHVSWAVPNTSTKGIFYGGPKPFTPNSTSVVSFYARGTGGAVGSSMNLYWNTAPTAQVAVAAPALTGSLQRYVFRVTWGASVDPNLFISITRNAGQAAGSVDIDAVQVEPGGSVNAFASSATFGYENAQYSPDVSSLSDKVWVVGNTFLSAQQAYTIPVALVNGSNYQFPLPGSSTKSDIVSVTVGGVGKTIGQAPGDGDVANQSTFKTDALIQTSPAVIAFAVTPPNATTIVVTGKFRYPLIQAYSDPVLVAAAGGLLFEAVVRDRRINDLALAQSVAKAYLANQGLTLKGLTCTVMQRSLNNVLLAPGQVITVNGARLFTGLGGPNLTFLITRTNLVLDEENDLDHPFRFELEMVDHAVTGGY